MKKKQVTAPFATEYLDDRLDIGRDAFSSGGFLRSAYEMDEEEREHRAMMANVVIQEIVRRNRIEEGKIIKPDKYGCYSILARYYMDEFFEFMNPHIANALIKHVHEDLEKYNAINYISEDFGEVKQSEYYRLRIMNLIVNGLALGDSWIKRLIVNVHKHNYRAEYKVLKRFGSISASELYTIAKSDEGIACDALARVVCVCEAMDIQLKPDCDFVYTMLNNDVSLINKRLDEEAAFFEIPPELIKESMEWFKENVTDERIEYSDKRFAKYRYTTAVKEMAYERLGFIADYDAYTYDYFSGIDQEVITVRAMLKSKYPNKEFTLDELCMMAVLYGVVTSQCNSVEEGK